MQNKAGVSNLLDILSAVTDKPIADLEKKNLKVNVRTFKTAVADEVSTLLTGLQERFHQYRNDEALLDNILRQRCGKKRVKLKKPWLKCMKQWVLSLQNNLNKRIILWQSN